MWGVTPSELWDWNALRSMIAKNGIYNSLLVAPMPTASASQILGNNECFEPYTSNIYSRRVLSGEFVVVNKHLLYNLTEMGLWSPTLKNQIIYEDGSVQKISEIPRDLKAIYKLLAFTCLRLWLLESSYEMAIFLQRVCANYNFALYEHES